ncbi:hypothetical protein DFH94DRAFT_821791 [Russula ochroleuca]|uniref:Uncharacterized protein n=1 Tax=Russula ochroleuca TaxID=152965 RepID=A0A9P5JVJ2_9AGAM|nr:hypothetical protein DFH94DRAFT_821791 [Russula ochroleuca]
MDWTVRNTDSNRPARLLSSPDVDHPERMTGRSRWKHLQMKQAVQPPAKEFGKTIIMPIAVPGVGKTLPLYSFKNVKKVRDVVIADKNNYLHKLCEDLRGAVKGMHPPVRVLALNWSLDRPHAEIHHIF